MLKRLLLPFCALIVPVTFAQTGFFGAATGHPKAGDPAPDLRFSRLLSAPGPGSFPRVDLTGQVTVLSFFPDTSHNPQAVAEWNARQAEYAGRAVQFVWITGEPKETLMPALARHPIAGWVLYDPEGETAKAYGLDQPGNIFIGSSGRIAGFEPIHVPDRRTLDAVLDGRITSERPTQSALRAFLQSNRVVLDAQPFRMPEIKDRRPKFSPSYVVHITPSAGERNGNYASDDFLVLEGVTVQEAIEQLYDVTPARLLLPASLQSATLYDFALLLPAPESPAKMKVRMAQALQEFVHVRMTHETRMSDVYVVSLAPGRKPPRLTNDEPGAVGSARASNIGLRGASGPETARQALPPQSLGAVFSLDEEGTIDDLCRDLESSLDRPVVNETGLEGIYNIQAQIRPDSSDNFIERLLEQTGLTISPARRTADFLRFQPAR